MVYNNNLIAVIKHKGKVLREEFPGNFVRLPFGSDYSIYIKNKDTMRKVVVEVKVDGKDVLDGNNLLVEPGSTTELKGFMKGSVVNNKFRFIEKTDEISNHRGNFVEDGLVELKYRFEEYPKLKWAQPITTWTSSQTTWYGSCAPEPRSLYADGIKDKFLCSAVNDSGITVPGAETKQQFSIGQVGALENVKYNIIINLKGVLFSNNKNKSITVKTKLRCPTCGRRWSSSLKYCGNCSTYLR